MVSRALITASFLVACAALKLRYAEPDLKRPYRVPGDRPGIWLAILASAAVLLLMIVSLRPAALAAGVDDRPWLDRSRIYPDVLPAPGRSRSRFKESTPVDCKITRRAANLERIELPRRCQTAPD